MTCTNWTKIYIDLHCCIGSESTGTTRWPHTNLCTIYVLSNIRILIWNSTRWLNGCMCKCKVVSVRACIWVWGLVAQVLASLLSGSGKKFESVFNSKWGLSVLTTFDYSHCSNCIHIRAKISFIGLQHLPKLWGKKPKATTKVTLKSHRLRECSKWDGLGGWK